MTDVTALAAQGPRSPAFRIRVVLPASRLANDGLRVRCHPQFTDDEAKRFAAAGIAVRLRILAAARRRLARVARELDDVETVLIQRQADMLPTLSVEAKAIAQRRLVLDVDDAIWHDVDGAGGHALSVLKRSRHKVDWLAERADVVVAGNEILAEYLSQRSRAVRIIPSFLDVDAVEQRSHEDGEAVVLGWIGSHSTVAFLDAKRTAIESFAAAIAPRPVVLLIVGGSIQPVRGTHTELIEWSETTERLALARMDIGLMPLEDTAFTRGKCAYKALQYMAAGIPVVADDVGVSASVIGDGHGGLIAPTPESWVNAMKDLAGDAGLRARFGHEGRRRVTEQYSYERWLPDLAVVLRGD